MRITQGAEFTKELKKLKKKYPSLTKDLEILERVIEHFPYGEDSRHCNILKKEEERCICRRRMMCRSVRDSEFHVIYYYDGTILELQYIEIYYKGKKEAEDTKRVEKVWGLKKLENKLYLISSIILDDYNLSCSDFQNGQ